MTIVWLEGLGQLKNPITSSETEPAAFWLTLAMLLVVESSALKSKKEAN
jgi:hypothetical protein